MLRVNIIYIAANRDINQFRIIKSQFINLFEMIIGMMLRF
jgi:hypothetical protein